MKIDLSCLLPAFRKRCDLVKALTIKDPGIAAQRDKALETLNDPEDMTDTLDALHMVQRLYFTSQLDILDNPAITEALNDKNNFPSWSGYAALNATQQQKETLARQSYEGYPGVNPVIVFLGDYARTIGELIVGHCFTNKDRFDVWFDDRLFVRRMMHHLDKEDVIRFGEMLAKRYYEGKRRIVMVSDFPSIDYIDPSPSKEMDDLRQLTFMKNMQESGLWESQLFTGTTLPSHQEAILDGLTHEAYVNIYFDMCEIDLQEVDKAHKVLIEKLNKGEEVHITNNDGTDIRFGIKGMTFLNSLIEANIPGTEVFSAPVKEKVNGVIVAKGLFNAPRTDNNLIRDITLEFKDGYIIRAEAAEGQEHLLAEINKDEGSRYLGELAFGTNPALTRHVSNDLLVEKIGGSFHVAIGSAYENEGDAIINNGNKSMVHWDITTMLRGKDGIIAIDGEKIMEGGVYLDPRLAYLNGKDDVA